MVKFGISIHALTRSATSSFVIGFQPGEISIHALTRSATIVYKGHTWMEEISIHALTRSATKYQQQRCGYLDDFNPRTHEECDPKALRPGRAVEDFNPRTHEECDPTKAEIDEAVTISIHALTRSATPTAKIRTPKLEFQSTHSRGVRRASMCRHPSNSNFNPRTHEECDYPSKHYW